MTDCCFCDSLPADGKLLTERMIWCDGDFYLTPTVGPLTDGHVMLIPHTHVSSFGKLDDAQRGCAQKLLRRFVRTLERTYPHVVVFEHGMADGRSGGCGISHAHIHIVPALANICIGPLPRPDGEFAWEELGIDDYLRRCSSAESYLLLCINGRAHYRRVNDLPSQYLRRWLANHLDKKEWDWRSAEPGIATEVVRLRRAIRTA